VSSSYYFIVMIELCSEKVKIRNEYYSAYDLGHFGKFYHLKEFAQNCKDLKLRYLHLLFFC